ncbi:MAG: hypothetical protein IT269_05530 [Saprospiraceae bacterium]|nr:hypothetical protein [Saprospiraceae bacterium]
MELTDHDLELLEAYFLGTLNAANKREVESRLQNDTEFREAAATFLTTLATLEQNKFNTHAFHLQKTAQPAVSVSWTRRWWWAAAAVIAGLIGGVWGLTEWNQKTSAGYLIASNYYTPYTSKMGTSSDNSAVSPGILMYENEQYKKAIPLLQEEISRQPNQYKAFLLANAYIIEKAPERAIPILQSLDTEPPSLPNIEIKWYLAMAYLYSNQVENAKPYLNALTGSESSMFRDKAQKVLTELQQTIN